MTTDILYGKPEDPTTKKPAVEGVTTKWVGQMPEIVDPRFLEGGALAFPLPPLVGCDWGREVTHSSIPLASEAVELEEEKKEKEEAKPAADVEPDDVFARSAAGGATAMGGRAEMGGEFGGRGGMPGMGGGRGFGGPPGMSRGFGGEMGGEMGGRGYGGMGGRGEMMMGGGGGGRGGFGPDGEPLAALAAAILRL